LSANPGLLKDPGLDIQRATSLLTYNLGNDKFTNHSPEKF
jgi:hypothetical protein